MEVVFEATLHRAVELASILRLQVDGEMLLEIRVGNKLLWAFRTLEWLFPGMDFLVPLQV